MGISRKRKNSEIDSEDFDDSEQFLTDEDEDEDEDEYEDEGDGGEEEEEGDEKGNEEKNNSRNDEEMEELEREYMNLRNQEQDILKNLKRHKDEDILKGKAVKNQKAIWDKTLEFRFLLQKAFAASNRLPQEPIRSSFCDSDEEASAAYSDLTSSSKKTLESLLELQQALLEKNPSISESVNEKHSKDSSNVDVEDEDWLPIYNMHRRIAPFRDRAIDKWKRKTQVTSGAAAIKGKLHAFNQNISEQVATYMKDPIKMMKQMRLRRSNVGVFGTVPELMSGNSEEEAHPDGDPELLSDSEFYQQLLKEFFETLDPSSSESAFYALRKLQPKKRKIVDRRASKCRKIRYNVHEKIVNFMAPEPMWLPPVASTLFANLFGLKTQKAIHE